MIFVRNSKPDRLTAAAWRALQIADQLHLQQAGRQLEVTSTTEGKHSVGRSAHYRGDAFDMRFWYIERHEFAKLLRELLGPDYVVVVEATHIHCHWSPIYHAEKDDML